MYDTAPRISVVEMVRGNSDLFTGDYSFEVQSVYVETLGAWSTDSRTALTFEAHSTSAVDFQLGGS